MKGESVMEHKGIITVEHLLNDLKHYPTDLPVTMFDTTQGYVSVAFKKEIGTRNGQTCQWLTFYPNTERAVYTVDTLIDYLQKLPLQAHVLTKAEDNHYSSLFLAIDSMTQEQKTVKWLVVNDRLTYEKNFSNSETDETQQALTKLLDELKAEHTAELDKIHHWICRQEDSELVKGILKADRTLQGGLTYCYDKAKEQAKGKQSLVVDDDTVFSWVKEYYLLDKIETKQQKVQTKPSRARRKDSQPKEKAVNEQVSLFELA